MMSFFGIICCGILAGVAVYIWRFAISKQGRRNAQLVPAEADDAEETAAEESEAEPASTPRGTAPIVDVPLLPPLPNPHKQNKIPTIAVDFE
jgi:hypothetical protein